MSLSLNTLDNVDVTNKKVLLRVDYNVPMQDGKIENFERIERSLVTIKELLSKGATVILISHMGRPSGTGFEAKCSLKPIAKILEEVLQHEVYFASDCVGVLAEEAVNKLPAGSIIMLENLRFHKEETENDPQFSKDLASLADIYVNDAFSTAHRAHASTEGITNYLPSYAGRLMETEVRALEMALNKPKSPVVAVVGGAKVSTKLAVLHNLVKKVDSIIIGGGMGSTFLYAQGVNVQRSLHEPSMKEEALKILDEAKANNCEIVLPVDARMAQDLAPNVPTIMHSNKEVPEGYEILDAGEQSIELFKGVLSRANTILWNGPLGAFEVPPFEKATYALAQYAAEMTKNKGVVSVAGGGDTVSALEKAGVYKDFTYVSTAGGAFLEWMEGKSLPGVEALLLKD